MIRQTLLKSKLVKIKGTWQKVYRDAEAPARYTSWKSINLMIDAAIDHSVNDHTILHKPFTPILLVAA